MGEGKILDALDRQMTGITGKMLPGMRRLFLLLIFLLAAGCRTPRIIVLDDSLTPEEHLNLGVSYEKNDELDAAAKEYRAAAESIPAAYIYLGNVSFRKGEYAEAEDYYRKAIEKDPAIADAYNNLAWLLYTERRGLEEAEGLALRAVELNPAKADLYRDTLEKIRALTNSR
jgi:tetratricopeptide (TPR) repeat protein